MKSSSSKRNLPIDNDKSKLHESKFVTIFHTDDELGNGLSTNYSAAKAETDYQPLKGKNRNDLRQKPKSIMLNLTNAYQKKSEDNSTKLTKIKKLFNTKQPKEFNQLKMMEERLTKSEFISKEKNKRINELMQENDALRAISKISDFQSHENENLHQVSTSKRSQSDNMMQLSNIWRKECFKAILARNIALQSCRIAQSETNAQKRSLQEMTRQNQNMIDRIKAKHSVFEDDYRISIGKHKSRIKYLEERLNKVNRKYQKCRLHKSQATKKYKRTRKLVQNFLNNTKVLKNKYIPFTQRKKRSKREKTWDDRGGSIVSLFLSSKDCAPAQSRDQAMINAIALLNDYIFRLEKASSDLDLIKVSLRARNAELRRGEAVLAVERSIFYKRIKLNDILFKNMKDQDFISNASNSFEINCSKLRNICQNEIMLHPFAEALLRGIFTQVDQNQASGPIGRACLNQLIKVLEEDERIELLLGYFISSHNGWTQTLKALKCTFFELLEKANYSKDSDENDALKGKVTIKWSEFLMHFLPNGKSVFRTSRNSSDIITATDLSKRIALETADRLFEQKNFNAIDKNKDCIGYEHVELILPTSYKVHGDHVSNCSNMNKKRLRYLVKRLNLERSWLIGIIYKVCINQPRQNAAQVSFGLCEQFLNEREFNCKKNTDDVMTWRNKVHLLKRSLHKSEALVKKCSREIIGMEEKLSGMETNLKHYKQLEENYKMTKEQLHDCQKNLLQSKDSEGLLKESLAFVEKNLNKIKEENSEIEIRCSSNAADYEEKERYFYLELCRVKEILTYTSEQNLMMQEELSQYEEVRNKPIPKSSTHIFSENQSQSKIEQIDSIQEKVSKTIIIEQQTKIQKDRELGDNFAKDFLCEKIANLANLADCLLEQD